LASIRLEFFGVARRRANVAAVDLDVDNLLNVIARLQEQFPSLVELCVTNGQLAPGWLLNVNGAVFTRDLSIALNDGDNVLLIPADAGG
jgi:molybdopterin converting factor small subunit